MATVVLEAVKREAVKNWIQFKITWWCVSGGMPGVKFYVLVTKPFLRIYLPNTFRQMIPSLPWEAWPDDITRNVMTSCYILWCTPCHKSRTTFSSVRWYCLRCVRTTFCNWYSCTQLGPKTPLSDSDSWSSDRDLGEIGRSSVICVNLSVLGISTITTCVHVCMHVHVGSQQLEHFWLWFKVQKQFLYRPGATCYDDRWQSSCNSFCTHCTLVVVCTRTRSARLIQAQQDLDVHASQTKMFTNMTPWSLTWYTRQLPYPCSPHGWNLSGWSIVRTMTVPEPKHNVVKRGLG